MHKYDNMIRNLERKLERQAANLQETRQHLDLLIKSRAADSKETK